MVCHLPRTVPIENHYAPGHASGLRSLPAQQTVQAQTPAATSHASVCVPLLPTAPPPLLARSPPVIRAQEPEHPSPQFTTIAIKAMEPPRAMMRCSLRHLAFLPRLNRLPLRRHLADLLHRLLRCWNVQRACDLPRQLCCVKPYHHRAASMLSPAPSPNGYHNACIRIRACITLYVVACTVA
jgi:hypothetical protein